jgi:SgrR family transcriptional regulator
MQLTNHYLQLRTSFEHAVEGKPIRVTLDELASRLYCTTRNVKLLLKKMAELGWIGWEPGRGRGNASELSFHVPASEIISREAVELAQKGDFKGAMELINLYAERYPLKESFVEWLFSYFGYKAEEKEERRLDTLRFPLFKTIQTLDPAFAYFALDCHIILHIFDTLIRFNTQTKTLEPQLAHYWETNEDFTSWTFYLRKGVLFHHGRELTAYDVKYTLHRLMDPEVGSYHSWLVSGIKEITVLNRTTLRIDLKQPNRLFLQHLSCTAASVVPEEICRESGALFARMPIGTGAFKVECHDELICRLRAFDSYFGERPHLDQVELWVLPEQLPNWRKSPQMLQVMCDHRGLTNPLGFMHQESPEWTEMEDIVVGCSLLTFNLRKRGPHRNALFRQAVDLLINREEMVRRLGGKRVRPATGFLPLWNGEAVYPEYEYDVDKAKSLLQEMGYNGEPLRLYTYHHHPEDAFWIRDQCALAGIPVEVCTLDRSVMVQPERIAEADMIYYQVILEDYDFTVLSICLQSNSFVRAHLGSELLEAVENKILELQREPMKEGQQQKMRELEALLKDNRALLFLLQNSFRVSYHSSIKGVTVNSLGWVDFRKVFFSQPSS